jgi:DNA-binding XRE family transcriptional regulator
MEPKKRKGQAPHIPTEHTRQLVSMYAAVGTTQEHIAKMLGVNFKTLAKYYRDELDLGMAKANATIGGALFNKAKGGDTTAMIFWMKTRAGWREKQDVNHTSDDGTMTPKGLDVSKLSTEALEEIVRVADEAKSK